VSRRRHPSGGPVLCSIRFQFRGLPADAWVFVQTDIVRASLGKACCLLDTRSLEAGRCRVCQRRLKLPPATLGLEPNLVQGLSSQLPLTVGPGGGTRASKASATVGVDLQVSDESQLPFPTFLRTSRSRHSPARQFASAALRDHPGSGSARTCGETTVVLPMMRLLATPGRFFTVVRGIGSRRKIV
jgi:hypothetical protein